MRRPNPGALACWRKREFASAMGYARVADVDPPSALFRNGPEAVLVPWPGLGTDQHAGRKIAASVRFRRSYPFAARACTDDPEPKRYSSWRFRVAFGFDVPTADSRQCW
jgi:hypothetical protein